MFLNARFGCVESQTCIGVAGTNTIERFYDAFGRDAGYALNGVRQSTLAYDPSTGRLATMRIPSIEDFNHHSSTPTLNSNSFTWNYLDGSDIKSSLAYPNGLTASWTYGNRGELLEVNNALADGSISKYAYTYDAAGRRVACAKSGTAFEQSDSVNYGYNTRSELTSATAAVDSDYRYGYNFDDIGNRKTSAERGTNSVYTASQLNQYTAVDDFTPTYDADGNETLVKTATGIWQVTYNGENRPVRWELVSSNSNTPNSNTQTLLRMSFDRMGRRVTKNDQRFVYDGYLQIADNGGNTYIWDCTENVATRPLAWLVLRSLGEGGQRGTSVAYYTHDGNKNVSDVIASDGSLAAHYEYAPFGALTVSRGTSAATNPFRFSSEYAEDDTATVYYNYRHYEPVTGRWMQRDPIEEDGVGAIYSVCKNSVVMAVDFAGMSVVDWYRKWLCGDKSRKRQIANKVERGKWEVKANVKYEIIVAGPKFGGYPGEGDSSTLLFWYSQDYIDWDSVENKEDVYKAIGKRYKVPCRIRVRYAVDCECDCNGKTLHNWSEYSDWTYIYGRLGWDALAGRPYCECGNKISRFYRDQKSRFANACKLED